MGLDQGDKAARRWIDMWNKYSRGMLCSVCRHKVECGPEPPLSTHIVKPPDASQISSLYTRKTPYTDYV